MMPSLQKILLAAASGLRHNISHGFDPFLADVQTYSFNDLKGPIPSIKN